MPPGLELKTEENAAGNILLYKWNADAEGFDMPVSYRLETGEVRWLHTTTSWQRFKIGVGVNSDLHFHMDKL